MTKRMAQAITNLMPAEVSGGRSARPSFMNSQVDPQMPQSTSQTRRAFIYFQLPIAIWFRRPACALIGNRHLAIGNDLFGRIREFDDRKRSTLWIVQDGEPSDTGNVFGRLHYAAANLGDFLRYRVTVVDGKVHQPVRRDSSHLGSYLVHATVTTIAVLEDRVSDRASGKRFCGPTKHVTVKLTCRRSIAGAELVPAKRTGHVVNYRASVLFGLPDREHCVSRIFDHSHAADTAYVKWAIHYHCAGGFRFFARFVSVVDEDITQPVWGNSLGHHVRHHFVKTTDVFAGELNHGVDHVRAHRVIFVFPAKELGVKIFGVIAAARSELNPTESAGLQFRRLLHSCFSHVNQSSLSSDKWGATHFRESKRIVTNQR